MVATRATTYLVMPFLLRKWNYETHEYLPFISPAIVLSIYSEDMLEEVDCANCGTRMTYGDTYTSRTIHNDSGIGFPVCDPCYQKELEEENAHPNNRN